MDDQTRILGTIAEEIMALRKEVTELRIWRMALKDIISRLISYAASNSGNEDEILRHFSEAGDHISDRLIIEGGEDFEDISERMRQQKDWLISNARSLLRQGD